MSIELVIPSDHLILCHPLPLLPSVFPSIRTFSSESARHIRWPKNWSFTFNISPSREYSGLILLYDWLVWSLCCPRDSQESSPAPQFKNINSLVLSLLYCYCYSFKLFFGNNKDSVKNSHTPFTQIHELLTFCHNWFYHIFLNHMRLSCKYHALLLLENLHFRDFPGSPGVKTLQFQCREHRFDPWLGNFPACHAVQPPKTCIS